MSAHAMLGPSSSHRWLTCTPSAKLETQFPDSQSVYANEGSFAHTFAELRLRRYLQLIKTRTYHAQLKKLEENPHYSKELEEYIENYVTFAAERISEAQSRSKDAVIMLEQRLNFSQWVPEGFGTGDLIIVSDGVLDVTDLKYGKGIRVFAKGNPQMRLYALGAYAYYEMLYDIQTIRMTIHQPRLDHIDSDEMSVNELLNWAEKELKPKAQLAMAGEGEFVAGEHCRFCRAGATCRARAETSLEMAKHDFCDAFLLSNEEIGDVLARVDELLSWAKDIQDYALDQAVNHEVKFNGWKLVEGRSNRKYFDEKDVADTLLSAGYEAAKIYAPRELFGITAMEKEIGKKRFSELLNRLIVKPPGKPTLALVSDKRPEISSADSTAKDFSEGAK